MPSHPLSFAAVEGSKAPNVIMPMPEQQARQTEGDSRVGDSLRRACAERALDEGVDYFQVDGMKSRARATDPETSHAAADNAHKFAGSHAKRILAALKANGPRTAHELSLLIGLSVVQIDRRTVELQRAKLIDVVLLSDGGLKVVDGFRLWRAL